MQKDAKRCKKMQKDEVVVGHLLCLATVTGG
jgi:hypothetical protein